MTSADVAVEAALGVSYARFSTDRQSSVPDQHRVNEGLAAEHGVRLLKHFSDEAQSRSLSERRELNALLEFLREHREVRYIVVNELERITGDLRQRVVLADICQELDVAILTEDGAVNPFDEEHQQEADEKAVGASAEVRKGRKRTRRSMKAKVAAGTVMMRPAFGTRMKPVLGPNGEPVPPGIQLVVRGKPLRSGVLEIEEGELPWLLQMFEWVADEQCSLDEVARRLTAAGVPTKTGAAAWSRSSVRGILTNPFYRGEYVWGRQKTVHTAKGKRFVERPQDDPERLVLDSPLGALVPVERWHRANDVMAARAGVRVHERRRVNPARPFDGMVFCGRCGHKMYGRADEKPRKDGSRPDTWRYYCIATRPGYGQVEGFGPPCKRSNAVSEKKIIDELALLAADPAQPRLVVTYAPPAGAAEQGNAYRRQLRELEARWQRTLEFGLRGLMTADEVATRKRTHEREADELRSRLAALEQQVPRESYTFEAAEALAGVIRLLRERTLPAEVLRAGLRDMGLVRVLADSPGLQIVWAG